MTTKNPHVSVIVPCYNRADTVREAIDSVLAQDYRPLDVIAVDDGSSDDTVAVLEQITDPRVRILHNSGPNGPSGARNHGISNTDAPWIAFQDSDDLWLPSKLSRQMDRLIGSDYVAAYCGMQIKKDTNPASPVQERLPDRAITPLDGDIITSLARGSYISTQMLVVRADILARISGFDPDLSALVDWELMLRVASLGPVAFIDEDLVIQRMSDNSITKSTQRRLAAQRYVLDKHRDMLASYPDILAHHHHRIAGGHRQFAEYKSATAHGWAAWKSQPNNLRYLAHAIYLQLRALAKT